MIDYLQKKKGSDHYGKYYQNEAADALVHRSASQIDAAEF